VELTGVVACEMLHLDVDLDDLAGADVGDAGAEDVAAVALDERRLRPSGPRLFVGAPRLAALLDRTRADVHDEVVHRGALGQREHVHAIDPVGAGVVEALGHPGAGDRAGDGDVDIGGQARRGVACAAGAKLQRPVVGGPGRHWPEHEQCA